MILFACAQTVAAQSTQPCEPPNGNIVADPVSAEACAGGSVQLEAPGGFSSYQWYRNGGIIDGAIARTYAAAESGEYSVRLFKQNCNALADNVIDVTIHPAVTAEIGTKTDVSCAGGNTGSVTVTGSSGTAPYTYRLGTGEFVNTATFENLAAGDYTITVRDANGCTADLDVTIASRTVKIGRAHV